jgi:ribosomal protein S27E
MYVVCQTPRCQQTYPMEHFGVITKDTKNVSCDKCGGVLVDENGKANFSQNATVIPVIDMKEYEKNRKRELKEKKKEFARLKEEIRELEEDY